jgi:hypothetical protein
MRLIAESHVEAVSWCCEEVDQLLHSASFNGWHKEDNFRDWSAADFGHHNHLRMVCSVYHFVVA